MTRAKSRPRSVPEPDGAEPKVATPITALTHLAEAAHRRGETDRVIRVDPTPAQVVRTPGRRPGQWLGSGAPVTEIEQTSALADYRETGIEPARENGRRSRR